MPHPWLIAFVLLSPASGDTMKCSWTERSRCDPGTGCQKVPVVSWSFIDVGAHKYRRCNDDGCDSYDASIKNLDRGSFIVDMPGEGLFTRVDADGAATEVASRGSRVLVSQGSCAATSSWASNSRKGAEGPRADE